MPFGNGSARRRRGQPAFGVAQPAPVARSNHPRARRFIPRPLLLPPKRHCEIPAGRTGLSLCPELAPVGSRLATYRLRQLVHPLRLLRGERRGMRDPAFPFHWYTLRDRRAHWQHAAEIHVVPMRPAMDTAIAITV